MHGKTPDKGEGTCRAGAAPPGMDAPGISSERWQDKRPSGIPGIANGIILGLGLSLLAAGPALSIDLGVAAGDSAAWSVRIDGPERTGAEADYVELAREMGTLRALVQWVRQPLLVYDLTARYLDGAAVTLKLSMNVSSGSLEDRAPSKWRALVPALGTHIIPGGLGVGDSFSVWWKDGPRTLSIEEVHTAGYAGAAREVVAATMTASSGNITETLSGRWDRTTGLLCEATIHVADETSDRTVHIELMESSRWGVLKGFGLGMILMYVGIIALALMLFWRRFLSGNLPRLWHRPKSRDRKTTDGEAARSGRDERNGRSENR